MTSDLQRPVILLHGVGPERAAQLARLGLKTIEHLLFCRPRRYEDRRRVAQISALKVGDSATARGRIVDLGVKTFHGGFKSVFELILDDGTGRLHCRWWNLPYLEKHFRRGDELLVYGKVNSARPKTIDHPETEIIETGLESSIHVERIVPIYPLTEGLSQRWLRGLIFRALRDFGDQIEDSWNRLELADLPSRREAVQQLHFPPELADVERARRRLALDELISVQLEMRRRRLSLVEKAKAMPCRGTNRLIKPFLKELEFTLTDSQQQVLREIRADLGANVPMRRLLQGDVGSGKTVVAACCALMAIESGFNVLLMAPTEILAEQHYALFGEWFRGLGILVHLRTGGRQETSEGGAERRTLTIGTHALIQDSFARKELGLVIIDEQHKFGVAQRQTLVRKGRYPHLLIMTATPIPRTLALTWYGDLDVSTIQAPPQGRRPIKTFVRSSKSLPKVWEFIEGKLKEGRQAYVVCPRIEENGSAGLKAVTQEYEVLKARFSGCQVGLLHGRMRTEDKEKVMRSFRQNEIQVLLATQVIEVGVDVPNASVLVIESAERFGLSQLHQLRGRIGRGPHQSYCILVSSAKSEEANHRLRVLAETSNGFEIAEADLRMRGPGDLLGRNQSGLPPLVFADLTIDGDLIARAKEAAERLIG